MIKDTYAHVLTKVPKHQGFGVEEAEWLGGWNVLPQDLSLISNIHMRWLTLPFNSRRADALVWPP